MNLMLNIIGIAYYSLMTCVFDQKPQRSYCSKVSQQMSVCTLVPMKMDEIVVMLLVQTRRGCVVALYL